METIANPEKKQYQRTVRYVRLSQTEHQQLAEDERKSGKNGPELLKAAYFGGGRMVLLMSDEDRDRILAQMRRIGNNVNQIAKNLNTGILYGFEQELNEVRAHLSNLMTWITGKYGANRK